MYGSPQPATSKDLNLPFGHRKEEADLVQHRQQQMSSGLLRYRSAPSSFIADLCDDFLPVRTSSQETETMFAHFGNTPPNPAASAAMEAAAAAAAQQQHHHMLFQSHQQQQIPSHPSSVESLYRTASSSAMEAEQLKSAANGGVGANLIRQSSSPAGLFSHLNVENGYGMMRGMSGFRNRTNSMEMDNSGNRLKGQLSFSSRQGSLMSQISETGSEGMDGSSPEEDGGGGGRCYIPGYPVASWEDSPLLSDNFSGLKRAREADEKIISGLSSSEAQNGEGRNHVSGLSHQFSLPLPKSSSDMATFEKLLQFQDAVPCKIRAKRGCATHPRSIAERVRRTRISERMRKLQVLVPNMDKQTNTADMLDLAVEYIKDLQKQVKGLNESRANCTCSASKQRQY